MDNIVENLLTLLPNDYHIVEDVKNLKSGAEHFVSYIHKHKKLSDKISGGLFMNLGIYSFSLRKVVVWDKSFRVEPTHLFLAFLDDGHRYIFNIKINEHYLFYKNMLKYR